MKFEEVMRGILFSESTSDIDRKKSIVEKIESEVKNAGYQVKISDKSKEVFYGNKNRNFVTGINNLCIAGIGKENYEEVYKIISQILKDDKDFIVTKDNYFTLFLDVKPSSDMYVKESSEDIVNVSTPEHTPSKYYMKESVITATDDKTLQESTKNVDNIYYVSRDSDLNEAIVRCTENDIGFYYGLINAIARYPHKDNTNKLYVYKPDGDYKVSKFQNGKLNLGDKAALKLYGVISVYYDKDGSVDYNWDYVFDDNGRAIYNWQESTLDVLLESKYSSIIPEDIIEFNKELNSYDYGFMYNGDKLTGKNLDYGLYKTLSISEFEKYKIGTCYDYTHYEAKWFKDHKYKHDTYYIETEDEDGDHPSHTFLVFYLSNSSKVYYFESAWGKYHGIEEFNSINELLNTILDRHKSSYKIKTNSHIISKYNAISTSYEHIGYAEFMKKASANRSSVDMYTKNMTESCKNVDEARKFLMEVDNVAKKYNANYYIVTDGASKTSNNGNQAVKYAREQMKEWERKHGFDPDEDWGKKEESVEELENVDYMGYFIEASGDTYYVKNEIYPLVESVLITPQGDRGFRKLVENYIDRNGQKLLTVGPVYLVPFTDKDKTNFYNLFNTSEKELKESIEKMIKEINDKASWKLVRQNPIFCLFYCCIRYYTVKNDVKGKDIACIIYALSVYPSVFYNYFQYGANPEVMQYTIDNMTNKFTIKSAGHILGTLRQSISNSWEFHKPYFNDMSDKEVIRFIQRIRNDQNSLLKKIANEFYKNYKKGLSVRTTVDSFDDNNVVDDITNNTSVVEDTARKVTNGMMTGGVNLKFAEIAARICQISIVDTRFYITKIMTEKNSERLEKFIESVLFIYLYDENHTTQDINSGIFISKFAPELFKKTNSNNPNIKFIKKTLDEWGEESGVHAQFRREASRVNYKKAIYYYIMFSIQSYAN